MLSGIVLGFSVVTLGTTRSNLVLHTTLKQFWNSKILTTMYSNCEISRHVPVVILLACIREDTFYWKHMDLLPIILRKNELQWVFTQDTKTFYLSHNYNEKAYKMSVRSCTNNKVRVNQSLCILSVIGDQIKAPNWRDLCAVMSH